MSKQTITLIKDPYINDQYESPLVAITFKKDGKEYKASQFCKNGAPNWKSGDEVTLDLYQKKGKDGKTYLNFKEPSLADRVEALEEEVFGKNAKTSVDDNPNATEEEKELEEFPFD